MKYYDVDGNEVSMEQWAKTFEDGSRFQLRTDLPGGVWVSTVLLGMDHNFGSSGPPLLFETMVFGPSDMADLDMERYSTKEQAKEGHERTVTIWTGWTPGDEFPDDLPNEKE